ncbi:MAG: ArnT family glycosyltransferase [Bacteroidia bacterium]
MQVFFKNLLQYKQFWLIFFFLFVLYFPFFLHIDSLPLECYDEARTITSSYEMYKSGNWLVNTFAGQPDMWATKPLLLNYCQIICFYLFGCNELSARLPVAMLGFVTCLMLIYFARKYLANLGIGMMSALILATSMGFVSVHGSRTADFDVPLTFFMTSYVLCFFLYSETDNVQSQKKYLAVAFLAVALALFTKSIAALTFAPGIALYLLWRKQLVNTLKNKYFWVFAILSLLPLAIYYIVRNQVTPGYWDAVWANDMGGRFGTVIEGHKGDFSFYFVNFMDTRYQSWIIWAIMSIVAGYFYQNEQHRKLSIYSSICSLAFLLVISKAQTKLAWYDIPMYPLLALNISLFFNQLISWLKNISTEKMGLTQNILPYLFLIFVFLPPYYQMLGTVYNPTNLDRGNPEHDRMNAYIQHLYKQKSLQEPLKVILNGYVPDVNLCITWMQETQKKNIKLAREEDIQPNDEVIFSQLEVQNYLEKHYSFDTLNMGKFWQKVKKYKIKGLLPPPQ